MINFTEAQLVAFTNFRETELAKWSWDRLKIIMPERAEQISLADAKGISFILQAHEKSKKYLEGLEDDKYYNKWRLVYGTLAFISGTVDFDQDPWNHSILTETLLRPYQRLDLLIGVFEICFDSPENIKFFDKMMKMVL